MITINNEKEMEKYYNAETNTYEFVEDNQRASTVFNFDININANIYAENIDAEKINAWNIDVNNINAWKINTWNIDALDIYAENINARNINAENIDAEKINARNINAENIDALDIDALDIYAENINAENIDAENISYYAVCFAYNTFKCKSVKGRRENSKHFCLDNDIEFIRNEVEEMTLEQVCKELGRDIKIIKE